jgi:hypothetical protein
MPRHSVVALIIVVSLSLTFFNATAQQRQFLIIYIKGKVEKKSRKKWIDLKLNDKLKTDDEVRLDRNAAMHVRDSAGRATLFMLPGIYQIGEVVSMKQPVSLESANGNIIFSNTARVKQNFFGSDAPIKVLLPLDSTFATLYAKQLVIRWIDKENKAPYKITIKTFFKETIATYESEINELMFDLNEERFLKERVFYVTITSKADVKYKSAEHVFKRILNDERFRVDDVLNKEVILDNSRALDQLILAGFYEEQALFVDAINAYLEAIKLGKNDPIYSEAFSIFLQRYGLDAGF